MSKEKKPRDLIQRLKVPDTEPPQYERDSQRMANLTKDYHEKLQQNELDTQEHTDFEAKLNLVLNKIPENQLLTEPERSNLNTKITQAQVKNTLHRTKNGSTTGMDGCPYELWKILNK